MSCKFYKKIIAALMVLSLASTVAILAYAEGDNDTPPVASSSQGSTISSDNTGSASSIDGGVSSDNAPAASSSAVGPSSVISAVTSSKKTPTAASSKVTSSKKPKTTSSKVKPSSRVYSSTAGQSYTASVDQDQYNNGSKSDTWEGGSAGVEVVSSKAVSSGKALSKHLTNPKKEILKLIWIPVLIALACIGVLLYTNLYLYKKKEQKHVPKHSAKAQKKAASGADAKDEGAADKKAQKDDDPFSAENFFHFDDN